MKPVAPNYTQVDVRAVERLLIHVERRRSDVRVVAQTVEAQPRTVMEVGFSGGPVGVWFKLSHDGDDQEFTSHALAKHPAIAAVLRLIGDEVEGPSRKTTDDALLEFLFHSLLIYVERINVALPRPHWGRPVRDLQIERALSILNSDIAKRWTVELLAKAVGLSRPVFARRFLATLGLSPMRYLTQRRMQVAAALLFSSDAALAEVASRVGYDSEFAFNRAFKRHYHMPPGEYRQRIPTTLTFATRMAA